ncbi:non-structural maintenance of chromosomes element 3 homolog [Anopheles nili]|uniref:non-structural maintenance of chromosomes element 3 homolog n=1 Tax=Anopheles nili TaxID=185578 RepID=UPI00237B13A7|nr:non-structural maintenance of chromosomes element 3 homolog [Anopheles nili]
MPRASQSQSLFAESSDSLESPVETHLIVNMVKTILNLSINKAVIKRTDIINIALKGDIRLYNRIIPEVIDILREIYGYELIEIESKSQKTMILCSTLEPGSLLELNESNQRKFTFLFLVLGYIYMKNGIVPENLLWEFLHTIGIEEQQEHSYFGEPKKIFESFIKQAYVMRFKQSMEGMSDEVVFVSWGVRSKHEVSKKEMLESICKIMKRKPSDFKTQYIETQGLPNTSVGDLMEIE